MIRSFCRNRSKLGGFNSVNVVSNYRHKLTVTRSQISSNLSQKTLCVNHCSKIRNERTPAWFTNQHLAAFDQKCPRIKNLFYDLLVDFKPFPRILFSSSSNTGNQMFLAGCSVSIIPFSTKFRSTFFLVIVLYWWETQIYVSV